MTSARPRNAPSRIVVVGGLIVELFISFIQLPALYVFWVRPDDILPELESTFMEE